MSNVLYSELLGRETFPALALMQIVLEGKKKNLPYLRHTILR